MIKSIFSFLFLSLLFLSALNSQSEVTAEDYKHAEKALSWNINPLVDRMNVRPRWQNDDSFWYKVTDDSKPEFVFYDPTSKTRKTASTQDEITKDLPIKEKRPSYNYRKESLSPDGKKVVFIKDWNLWMRFLDSEKEVQLTTDGVENFGYATDNAGWRKSDRPVLLWSPDSKKIATFQQDQRHVSDMYMIKTKVGAPELTQWKYPLPEDEDIIRIHRIVIDVEENQLIRFKMDPDPRRGTLCDDISCDSPFDDNVWNEDGTKLAFVSTSRDHKIAHLQIADTRTGVVKSIFKEEVETQYESGQGAINWKYLPSSNEFIWYSEKDNWGHLYLYDVQSGELKNQITKGDFVVTRVLEVDQKDRKIYFEANGREAGRDPYFSHFYRIDFSGKNIQLLTPEDGNHRLSFSPSRNYFVDNYSQPNVPPISVLRDRDGKKIATLEKADISRLLASGWNPPTPITVQSDNKKYDLYGLMFQPQQLDPTKKYPVVNYIYPGPQGGGMGSRSFSASRRDHQALANLGFVVIVIDGTCNPGRSKAFHDECYGDMSINTLPDQISGIKQLAERYSFIDIEKVGIWGHSGGGFATAAALFKYPDFYDVGISESGNHDNRNYEDDWGERYNGLMIQDENGKSNYEIQANQMHAENLKGKLLLAHGAMDDNVPVSNTYLVVDALHKANKDYDLIIFPNARHGFGMDGLYMMRRRWDYFVTHLQGKNPPANYKITYTPNPRVKKP
ncbi:MAG: DPP IV N-terminal domain-containing protein [Saprospiraceae bacterium]|nr:DPP IV N-terminal domain-containing protein [Saprospiraceae bacterium]